MCLDHKVRLHLFHGQPGVAITLTPARVIKVSVRPLGTALHPQVTIAKAGPRGAAAEHGCGGREGGFASPAPPREPERPIALHIRAQEGGPPAPWRVCTTHFAVSRPHHCDCGSLVVTHGVEGGGCGAVDTCTVQGSKQFAWQGIGQASYDGVVRVCDDDATRQDAGLRGGGGGSRAGATHTLDAHTYKKTAEDTRLAGIQHTQER